MTKSALKRKLTSYLSKLPENEYNILSEQYESLPYYIYVDTVKRHITISISEDGEIKEDYRMIRGQGSKQDFERCKKAMELFREYHKKHLKKFELYKEDFDKMIYKVSNDTVIRTLSINLRNETITFSDRKRKASKSKEIEETVSKPVVLKSESKEPVTVKNKPESKTNNNVPKSESTIKKSICKFKIGDRVEAIDDASHRVFEVIEIESDGKFVKCTADGGIYGLACTDLRLSK